MMKDNDDTLQTPYRVPGTDVTLESFCDDRHGFMRIEIAEQMLKGEYFTAPQLSAPWGTPAELRDSFILDLQTHTVKTGSAGTVPVE